MVFDEVTQRFLLKNKSLLPVVQGGMGIGISAHRLAGAVAKLGALGTISSVDLRRHHPDLMQSCSEQPTKSHINACNLIALDREIKAAKTIAQGQGAIAVNIMKAVSAYPDFVRQSCESGADAIVVGAGLPLDLPDLAADYPDVALIPILSDARGTQLVLRKWMRKNRLPDAIVLENPKFAAGHLGLADTKDMDKPNYQSIQVLEQTQEVFEKLGIAPIPLIVAGGIHQPKQVQALLDAGASAVQLGSAFAVTCEGDAHDNFKKVLVEAEPEDIVTFMSVAGLPARAVRTPWLEAYLHKEKKLQEVAKARDCSEGFDCLAFCGLRDGVAKSGQFCIDRQLAYALAGDIARGLFFRGSEILPLGKAIAPVKELMAYLLSALSPTAPAAAS
ncbi:nitronate monooxygenase family protein [Paenalcaligenes hermetiae]|uniref:Nitronate monooxygenase family protein n=1 Tax=Paenalcaligenes hermetiae TaxID=1157987 RepID=A0ABP9LZK9_9BURK